MKKTRTSDPTAPPTTLVLGIGNILMGDEGVGVAVIRHLEQRGPMPTHVRVLDGGTGSFALLGDMQAADRLILVDATVDGASPGTWRRLHPKYSSDYPPTLTAHDIGLKDLLDAFYLTGKVPDTTLYAVSIAPPQGISTDLSPAVTAAIPAVADAILRQIKGDDSHGENR